MACTLDATLTVRHVDETADLIGARPEDRPETLMTAFSIARRRDFGLALTIRLP